MSLIIYMWFWFILKSLYHYVKKKNTTKRRMFCDVTLFLGNSRCFLQKVEQCMCVCLQTHAVLQVTKMTQGYALIK